MLLRSIRQSRGLLRTYATAAKSAQPPVQLFGLDGSYASALYTASAKASSIETTEKSLKSITLLIEKDSKLANVLANPSLSSSDKKAVVGAVVQSSGVSSDKTIENFLTVLAENNRLNLIGEIASKFQVLSNAYHGLVEATVTSAEPLDKKIIGRLESALSKSEFVGQGKKLELSNKVNPDILGGLVVEIGDRTVDLSVSAKIARLNKLLTDQI